MLGVVVDQLLVVRDLPSNERRAVARGAERGEFARVRRGVYLPVETWRAMSPRERAMVRIRALQAASADPVLFSHWSAALVLGLPVPHREGLVVHRAVPPASAWSQPGVAAHRLAVPAEDVIELDGLHVTDIARTAVDLAAHQRFDAGVMAADAAMRLLGRGPVEGRVLLMDAWERVSGRRGGRRVAAVIAFADPLAESPAESRSRVTMHRLRLPVPVLQHEFADEDGEIGRGDFWFPDERVLGECDGADKYFDDAMNKGDPARAVYEEKLREDRIRALDVQVARWGWAEAIDPTRLAARLGRAGVVPAAR